MGNPALLWLHKAWHGRAALQADVVRGYKQGFGDPEKAHVEDLATFCFIRDTTHVPGDPYTSAVYEGRRQAFIHISNMLQITQAEINALNQGKPESNAASSFQPDRPPDDAA